MILGIGSDIVEIERIQQILERHNKRFLNRIFTFEEIAYAHQKIKTAATLANRFAAKEAMVKALGTGISQGIHWKDIQISNTESGQPYINLTGRAAEVLQSLVPSGMSAKIFCSLSNSDHYAQAVVVIEA